jgi:type II secretory pathway component PulM
MNLAPAQRLASVTERYAVWWRALPRRQQWLVLGAAAIAGLGLVDTLLIAPAGQRHRAAQTQIDAQSQKQAKAATDAARIASEQERLRAQEQGLRQRLDAAEAAIVQARAGLTTPHGLRERVRDLTQDSAVRLVSLNTLNPEPVQFDNAAAPAGTPPSLYRFTLNVVVEGAYAALGDYLDRLEASEQGLEWHTAALDNRHWPDVRLELRLVLLSDRPYWKGP